MLMIIGMTALASNDAILKLLGESFSAGQIMGMRGIAVCAILFVFMLSTRQTVTWQHLTSRWNLFRGLAELFATVCFISSLLILPLALATTLVFIAPVILTAVGGLMFGEKIGPWRWFAVFAGFIGVLTITWRGDAGIDTRILLPLATAAGVVCRDICTRFIPPDVSSLSVTMTTALVVTIAGVATLPFGWQAVSTEQLGWTVFAAAIINVSFFCYIVAIRSGELSVLAPIQYIVIVWALVFGYLFWSELPDTRAFAGGTIIISSGLLMLWRERVASRKTNL